MSRVKEKKILQTMSIKPSTWNRVKERARQEEESASNLAETILLVALDQLDNLDTRFALKERLKSLGRVSNG